MSTTQLGTNGFPLGCYRALVCTTNHQPEVKTYSRLAPTFPVPICSRQGRPFEYSVEGGFESYDWRRTWKVANGAINEVFSCPPNGDGGYYVGSLGSLTNMYLRPQSNFAVPPPHGYGSVASPGASRSASWASACPPGFREHWDTSRRESAQAAILLNLESGRCILRERSNQGEAS